jgi:phosphatidylglycerophosphatase A
MVNRSISMPDPSTTSAEPVPSAARVRAEPVDAPAPRAPIGPSFGFMRPRLARWIALGFGSGLSPVAPGTVGTLWAWAAFLAIDPWLSDAGWWIVLLLGFALGCWACERTGRDLGKPDHSGMVWDEVIAFWLVLLVVPADFRSQLAAFFVFRFFDVLKPPPIRFLDQSIKGGFGVMLDDLVAAFYTLLAVAVWSGLRS